MRETAAPLPSTPYAFGGMARAALSRQRTALH